MLWTKGLRVGGSAATLAMFAMLGGCGSSNHEDPGGGDAGVVVGSGASGGGSSSTAAGATASGTTAATTGAGGADAVGVGSATTGATGGTGGSDGVGSTGTGGGGASGSGTGGSAGAIGDDGGVGGGRPATPQDFEGIDLTMLPKTKVAGCAGVFDSTNRTLTLTLDNALHSVFVDAYQGMIRANETVCTGKDGKPITTASLGSLVITGSAGNDYVVIDLLLGDFGSGLLGTPSSIKIDLGAGTDTVAIRGTGNVDRFATTGAQGPGAALVNLGRAADCIRVDNIESMVISFGPSSDVLTQGVPAIGIPLVVYGGTEDDQLEGGSKNDVLNGGDGSDEFDESPESSGSDIINGGAGLDMVSYERRTNGVSVTLCDSLANTGCATPACTCPAINGEVGEHDVIVNVEGAIGGAGDDTLVGNASGNVLSGKGGNDRIDGGDGSDEIFGDAGDDTLLGGPDDDIIVGGTGHDTIDGQAGDDVCFYSVTDPAPISCEAKVLQ